MLKLGRKQYGYIALLVTVTLLACIPFFASGWKPMDDFGFHFNRFRWLVDEIRMGNLVPFVYNTAYDGYGYAAACFYPYLFLYPFALLCAAGVSETVMINVIYIMAKIVAGIVGYLCFREIFQRMKHENYERAAVFFSLFMLFDLYQWANLYKRGALGELLAAIFFPVIFLGFIRILQDTRQWGMLAIGMTGMLYSHVLSTMMACLALTVLLLCYFKTFWREKQKLWSLGKAAIAVLLFGCAFWIPFLEMYVSDDYAAKSNVLFSVLRTSFEETVLLNIPVSAIIGSILYLMLVLGFFAYKKPWTRFAISLLLSGLLVTSVFPWGALMKIVPFIGSFQFVWRTLGITVYLSAYWFSWWIGAQSNKQLEKWIKAGVCYVGVIVFAACIWRYCVSRKADGLWYNMDYTKSTSIGAFDYTTSKYYLEAVKKYPAMHYEAPATLNPNDYNGNLQVIQTDLSGKSKQIWYQGTDEKTSEQLVLPILYYKGYTVSEGGRTLPTGETELGMLYCKPENIGGVITVAYTGTVAQKAAVSISAVSLLGLVGCLFVRKKKNHNI